MNLNKDYWEKRYREHQTGWDMGQLSPPLKNYIDQLKDKDLKILIPGAGNSYEAEYLFRLGFKNTYVLDLAAAPLENLKARLPEFPGESILLQNFFQHQGKYDLILEQTFFCALPPDQRKAYAEKTHELLKPGGKLAGLFFDLHFQRPGPPFGGSNEEYLGYFEPGYEIKVLETCYNSIPTRQGNELFFIFKKK